MTTHSSVFAWRILWTQEPGRLQCMGFQWVGHDWATNTHIPNVAFLPTLSCFKSRTMSWFKAGCQLLLLCLEVEIGAQEITGGSHLKLESWDSLCRDVWISFHIVLFFSVFWMIWAHLVTHLLFSRICRLCYPFWLVGSQDIYRTITIMWNSLHRALSSALNLM